jgi:hypothetical protein
LAIFRAIAAEHQGADATMDYMHTLMPRSHAFGLGDCLFDLMQFGRRHIPSLRHGKAGGIAPIAQQSAFFALTSATALLAGQRHGSESPTLHRNELDQSRTVSTG